MMQLAAPDPWVSESQSHDSKKAGLGHLNPVPVPLRGSLALTAGDQGASRSELAAARSQANLREILGGRREGTQPT